jgi:hypothetical protein
MKYEYGRIISKFTICCGSCGHNNIYESLSFLNNGDWVLKDSVWLCKFCAKGYDDGDQFVIQSINRNKGIEF